MASVPFRSMSRVPRWVWWTAATCLLSLSVGIYVGEAFRIPVRHVLFNVFGVGKPAEVPPKLGAVAEGEANGATNDKTPDRERAGRAAEPGAQATASGEVAETSRAGATMPPIMPPTETPAATAFEVTPPAAAPPAAPTAPELAAPVPPAVAPVGESGGAALSPGSPATATPDSSPAATLAQGAAPAAAAPSWTSAPVGQGGEDYMALPVTVRVKVFVDELYARAHPDWLTRAQRTVALSSSALRLSTRIELELIGVVRFSEPLDGLSLPSLLSTLKHRARDGADVALAFVDHEVPADACAGGDVASAHHGHVGVVGPDGVQGYLSGTLRCLGLLMGAQLVEDQGSNAHRLGSFMRPDQSLSGQQAPWLDPENRARIMQRKGLPFGPSAIDPATQETSP